jgi:hypothetical protein
MKVTYTFNDIPDDEEKAQHIHIEIPGIPPSLNKLISGNRFENHRIKKNWEAIIASLSKLRPKKPIKRAIIYYIFHFRTDHRRDPDNMSTAVKFINDGLVYSKFLEDDSFDNVEIRIRRGDKAPEGEFTEVVIIDLDVVMKRQEEV